MVGIVFLLGLLGLIGVWLSQSLAERTAEEKAQIEKEYQEAQNTVLENLAGVVPESEPYLTVVPHGGRTIRINKLSGAWCVLIDDNRSNPVRGGSCSESDTYAERVREQKGLSVGSDIS